MQPEGRRVAVTGLGVVAPCGIGRDAFWRGLCGPGITSGRSTEIADWDPTPWYASPKEARRADRVEQFAIAAATEAFEQAGGVDGIGVDPARFGTIFATGVGGLHTLEEQVQVRLEKGERRVSPFLVPMMMANAAGAAISMRWGLQGPNETIATACAAGTHAIGNAARLIAWGRCDAVATGGAESAATLTALAGFGNMTALTTTGVSRPFDVDRDGFVMGEGSAVLILEEWDHAVGAWRRRSSARCSARRATPMPTTSPPRHPAVSVPPPACAWPSTTPAWPPETSPRSTPTAPRRRSTTPPRPRRPAPCSVRTGPRSRRPRASPVTPSVRPAPSRRRPCCCRSSTGLIPPTANTKVVDLGIDVVTGDAREWEPGPTMSNNFGFGGHNGSVILSPA